MRDGADAGPVLVAQIGARRHYAVPRALHSLGLLEGLVTDLSAESALVRAVDAAVPRWLRPRALDALLGRRVEGVPAARIASLPAFALSPTHWRRHAEAQTDHWARRNAAFCRAVVRRGLGAAHAVYAFNGAALEIFEAAKERGLATVLDQTSAPWRWNRALLLEERARWPGWETEPGEIDLSGALAEREEREWTLADRIVCGSQFAAEAAIACGAPRARVAVAAYPACAPAERRRTRAGTGVLRVLFVGTLELRKGVPYLLEAVRLLKGAPVEVRLVGPSRLSIQAMQALAARCEIAGPVPRGAVRAHYDWADVLVLPTLSEGSANVCREAIAAGLPVITTSAAGADVVHERTGLIVPAREPHALAEAMARLLAEPGLLRRLSGGVQSGDALAVYAQRLAACLGGGRA